MSDTCLCVECSTKVRGRLETLIKALNDLNSLDVTSPHKLDLMFVLSNEINSENNLVIQLKNNQNVLQAKIKEVDEGNPTIAMKNCIIQSLRDLKEKNPGEYETVKSVIDKYWDGKYQLEEAEAKPQEVK